MTFEYFPQNSIIFVLKNNNGIIQWKYLKKNELSCGPIITIMINQIH